MDNQSVELITRLVLEALGEKAGAPEAGFAVPVGVSARHVHLTQEHVEALFGEGYQLTKKKELMGGQFASNEQVTLVGTKLRAIENVRILGPVRKASQVEISLTDSLKLGVSAPIPGVGRHKRLFAHRHCGPQGRDLSQGRVHRGQAAHSYVAQGCTGRFPKRWRYGFGSD